MLNACEATEIGRKKRRRSSRKGSLSHPKKSDQNGRENIHNYAQSTPSFARRRRRLLLLLLLLRFYLHVNDRFTFLFFLGLSIMCFEYVRKE